METLKNIIFNNWSDNKSMVIFNTILLILLTFLTHIIDRPFWNLWAFLTSLLIISVSTVIDRKTYGNLSIWLVFIPIFYIIWWFLLNLPF